MMPFLIKFCLMELNRQDNVKEKIVAPMQGGLVEHAQKQVPVVSNLCSFLQLFIYIALLCQHSEHRVGNLLFISCFSLQRLELTKILVVNFMT